VKNFKIWLKKPNKKYPAITNLTRIKIVWDSLNPDKEVL
jgi:hypothetical protein